MLVEFELDYLIKDDGKRFAHRGTVMCNRAGDIGP